MLRRFCMPSHRMVRSLETQVRSRSLKIRVANRMTVENFHAQRYIVPTRLETAAPHIAIEWNFERNPMFMYPKIMGVASLRQVWWRCSKCDHEFEASCEQRVLRGVSCPKCKGEGNQTERDKSKAKRTRIMTKKKVALKKAKSAAPVPLPGETDPRLLPRRSPVFQRRTKY